ncbi:MAG: hypothetical protein JST46_10435 [Bacteroidetes bacterium]|nr:hypothetical protein [Bacteroidota bacterium]
MSKDVTYLSGRQADSLFKPNGLWYTMDDTWWAWVKEHNAENIAGYRHRHLLDVDMSNVCVLDDVKPVMEFHWKYSYKHRDAISAIDWQKVKTDYSGIEVRDYENLYSACAWRSIIWLQNWAVSSGCVWDMNAVTWNTHQ